jgi:hypothetical protein
VAKFDDNAEYLKHATGFESVQLKAMRLIIEAKVEELRELRYQREVLAKKIMMRGFARQRAERIMGPSPTMKRAK